LFLRFAGLQINMRHLSSPPFCVWLMGSPRAPKKKGRSREPAFASLME
jgi:hypothetical protein